MEQTLACGNDNKTYTTPCALHEEAMRRKSSSFLTLQHLGPCESRPWILSPLEDVLSVFGQRLALNCEAKGFPVPEIFWEFHAADGRTVLKLPGTLTCNSLIKCERKQVISRAFSRRQVKHRERRFTAVSAPNLLCEHHGCNYLASLKSTLACIIASLRIRGAKLVVCLSFPCWNVKCMFYFYLFFYTCITFCKS